MPALKKTGLGAGLVGLLGVTPTRLEHPLVYMKTRPVVGWAELNLSTHQFTGETGLGWN